MPSCLKCGREYTLGQAFCPSCGATLTGSFSALKYKIKYRPSYSMLVVKLDAGQSVKGVAGAMTYMSPNIEAKTHMREKGFFGTLGVSLLGGQSFFVNDFTAVGNPGEVGLVSAPLGDIETLDIKPEGGYIINNNVRSRAR